MKEILSGSPSGEEESDFSDFPEKDELPNIERANSTPTWVAPLEGMDEVLEQEGRFVDEKNDSKKKDSPLKSFVDWIFRRKSIDKAVVKTLTVENLLAQANSMSPGDDQSQISNDGPSDFQIFGEQQSNPRTNKYRDVEEKFGEQNFRVLSEMRFFGKIRVVILDFCWVCLYFNEICANFDFGV